MFKRIYFFYLTYLVAMVYSQTLLMLWFFKNGISFTGMLLYFLVMYLFVIVFFFALQNKKFSSRSALFLGVVMSALGVLTANLVSFHTYYVYAISVFFALNIVFFWSIYNALHFKYSEKNEHGMKSGAYFLFFPILGTILAPIAGLFVEKMGYHFLFSSAMLLYIIPLCFVFYLPNFDFKFESRKAFSETEYPLLVAFQGYIFMLTVNIVPIFTLLFITTPFALGSFLGYLAIFTAFAALINSKISDKLKKRASFFYIFNILNVLTYLPLVFSKSFGGWQIFSGINNLAYGLANPFNLTLTLDHNEADIVETMLGREILLNLGRVVMIIFLLILYYLTSSLWQALIGSALVTLLYPLLAYYRKVYLKK